MNNNKKENTIENTTENTTEEKIDINQMRYMLEHVMLPKLVLRERGPFIQTLVESKGHIIYNMMNEICRNENIDMPYESSRYTTGVGKLEEGFFGMVIGFPKPEAIWLCHRAIVIFNNECTDIGYYTIEESEKGEILCGYNMDDSGELIHLNYGDVPAT